MSRSHLSSLENYSSGIVGRFTTIVFRMLSKGSSRTFCRHCTLDGLLGPKYRVAVTKAHGLSTHRAKRPASPEWNVCLETSVASRLPLSVAEEHVVPEMSQARMLSA